MSYTYLFKYIIIGDTSVGKSCLMLQFSDRRFAHSYEPTIGVEFGSRTVDIEGKLIKLQIWDTTGQERFNSISRSYYRGASVAILVYDVTRRDSFLHIARWLADARNTGSIHVFVLVGNKIDLSNRRAVSYEEAAEFAEREKLIFFEASAKNADHVEDAFQKSAHSVYDLINSGKIDPRDEETGIKLGAIPHQIQGKLQKKSGTQGYCC